MSSSTDKDSLTAAIAAIADAMVAVEGPMPPKKRAVVEAAIRCISETGFSACSTKMIAQNANVAEATIFRHFATKQDLLERMIKPVLERVLAPAARQQFDNIYAHSTGPMEDILIAVLMERLSFVRKYFPLFRIALQELSFQPALREILFAQIPIVFDGARAVIEKEIADGRWAADDPERLMRQIGACAFGYIMTSTFFLPDRDWDDKKEVRQLVMTLLDGMRIRA